MTKSKLTAAISVFAGVALLSTTGFAKQKEGLLPQHEFRNKRALAGSDGFILHGACIKKSGITNKERHSKPSSAYLELDLSQDSWGAIMLREKGQWDLSDATLSVYVKADTNFETSHGLIGFKLIDADGTEYRTDNADLFRPKTEFTEFKQRVDQLYCVDAPGTELGLDLSNIVHYGVIFLDQGDNESVATFYVDDFRASRDDAKKVADQRSR